MTCGCGKISRAKSGRLSLVFDGLKNHDNLSDHMPCLAVASTRT
jgi:hypothetical protein